MSDYAEQIDSLIEYKKLIVKLEDSLKFKHLENAKLSQYNADLQKLIEELKSTCNDLHSQLLNSQTTYNSKIKEYEGKINSIESNHENEIKKYNEKILELSNFNPSNETKVKNEIELKYKNLLDIKEKNILNLKNEIQELKNNYTLIETEKNLLKKNLTEQLNTERNTNSFQLKNLLSKIQIENENVNNNDKNEAFNELKNVIKINEIKIEKLMEELESTRNEKNSIEIDGTKKIFELETKLKEEGLNNKILNDEIEDMREDFNKIKSEVLKQEMLLNEKNDENNDLINEKVNLEENLNQMRTELNLKNDEVLKLTNLARNLENDLKLKELENQKLKEQIEYMSNYENKKINIEKENKTPFDVNKNNSDARSVNLFKEEYEKMRQKYIALLNEQKSKNIVIINKDREIKSLSNYLKQMNSDQKGTKNNFIDLFNRYKEVSKKKIYYKSQCKIANKNIAKIINILTPKQKQDLEANEGNLLLKLEQYSLNGSDNEKDIKI